jgi:hypothetical protein
MRYKRFGLSEAEEIERKKDKQTNKKMKLTSVKEGGDYGYT